MSEPRSASKSIAASVWQYAGMVLVLVLLVLVFGAMSKSFLQIATWKAVGNRIPELTLVAVGMTWVLMIRGIDLSVGSLLALSSAALGVMLVDYKWPIVPAIVVCVVVGVLAGLVNGCVATWGRIPAFIMTLGMMEIARGGAFLLTDSQTKYVGSRLEWIGNPLAGLGLSPAFFFAIAVVCGGAWMLNRTVFGRYCVAIGTNAETVRMSGVRVAPYVIAVFALSGLMSAIAGVIQVSRLSSADPNAAVGLELLAIAACVIGGTSLSGGRGSVINTFFGVLIIAVLETGLAQVGASDPSKRLITGLVIIAAAVLDAWRQRRSV